MTIKVKVNALKNKCTSDKKQCRVDVFLSVVMVFVIVGLTYQGMYHLHH